MPPQPHAGPGPHPEQGGVFLRGRGVPVPDQFTHVDAVRYGHPAGRAAELHRARDPAEPEYSGGVAPPVPAGHVPAAVPVHHAPGLKLAPLRITPPSRTVAERNRPAVPDRLPQRPEGRFGRAQPGLYSLWHRRVLVVWVRVDASRPQFQQRPGGGAGQLSSPPDPRGQAEHGRLVRLQPQLGQLVGLLPDPVTGIFVERVVDTGLQRHAELAEILLVPLEHPLEQVILLRVAGHGVADLFGREVTPGGEQADNKAEQSLSLALRHRSALHWLPDYCLAYGAAYGATR